VETRDTTNYHRNTTLRELSVFRNVDGVCTSRAFKPHCRHFYMSVSVSIITIITITTACQCLVARGYHVNWENNLINSFRIRCTQDPNRIGTCALTSDNESVVSDVWRTSPEICGLQFHQVCRFVWILHLFIKYNCQNGSF
jgi:hypothetical protein